MNRHPGAANPARVLAQTANRFGDRVAFRAPEGWSVTYAELARGVSVTAAGLAAQGIGEGSLVALCLPSTVDYAAIFVAAAHLGAATVGINPRLTPPEQSVALGVVRPDLIVSAPGHAPTEGVAPVLEIRPATGADGLCTLLPEAPGHPVPVPVDPDPNRAVAVILTSGTTGTPKAAVFTEAQLDAIREIDHGDGWGDDPGAGGDILASTQFAHVGFMAKLHWYLQAGMTFHQLPRWRAGDALRCIAERRITVVGGVPTQLALLARHPLATELDLSHVRAVISGGGPVTPGLVEEVTRVFGAPLSVRYSSTESGGVGLATDFDDPPEVARSTVGYPRPGVEIRICDETGVAVPPGTVGELCLRSGAVMSHYLGDPTATQAALRPAEDGGRPWLRTGDMGRIDPSGRVTLVGRTSEMFIRGGYNVFPQEVEAALSDHPAVTAVAVAPRPDSTMGEIGVAVVVPRDPSAPPTLDELRSHAAQRVAHHKLPEAMVLVDVLPETAGAKLDRGALGDLVVDTATD